MILLLLFYLALELRAENGTLWKLLGVWVFDSIMDEETLCNI